MAADSEGKSEFELRWEARLRKEFQEDPAMWVHQRYGWITERINEQSDKQISEAKAFVENALELGERGLVATRESVILYVAIIAVIALAAAGLWIGVAGVALAIVLRRWFMWSAQKDGFRLDRFRHRFRELLEEMDGEMLAEDKEFLRKHEYSILFPFAVPEHKREHPNGRDLEHVPTLYREYCRGLAHLHLPLYLSVSPRPVSEKSKPFRAGRAIGRILRAAGLYKAEPVPEGCKLCAAAARVKQHIEGALSKVESEIASVRETLVARIDGSNSDGAILTREFLEDFCKWSVPTGAGAETRTLLEWLRDKERWTFEHADQVRELCKADESVQTGLRFKVVNQEEPAWRVYEKLSREIEQAAARCGLTDAWKWYDPARQGYANSGPTLKNIRRTLGRHNPEAMFRELSERNPVPLYALWQLKEQGLDKYGFDFDFVQREVKAAKKLMVKDKLDGCYERELAAAQAFAWLEESVRERRWKEVLQ